MILLEVKVRAGAKTEAVQYQADGSFRIRITTAPEKGKANKDVMRLLAGFLGVKKGQLKIVGGETCSHKKISLEDA
ncbi:MAG: DUF167 domain-containing protein [Patescibacteria group bacterium]|nr:DUF167 domain-containing protein [Patescibacteria group bacterium]